MDENKDNQREDENEELLPVEKAPQEVKEGTMEAAEDIQEADSVIEEAVDEKEEALETENLQTEMENEAVQIEEKKERPSTESAESGKGGKKKNILLILLGLIVALGAGIGLYIYSHNEKVRAAMAGEGIYPNITIAGIDVAGMSVEEAVGVLSEANGKNVDGQKITLTFEEEEWEISFEDMGAGFQVETAAAKAYAVGRAGTDKERFQTVSSLLRQGEDIPLEFTYDIEKLNEKLTEVKESFDQEAADSTMIRKDGRFLITEEMDGRAMNLAETSKIVDTVVQTMASGNVEIVAEVTKPQITYEDNQNVTDLIGSFTTKYTLNDRNRNINLEVGCKNLNGQMIAPGEVFSATEGLGPQTYARGYRDAGVYVNGKVENGMGGGVCQITTTLYNAAIFAELEIVERHPHSMTVGYVPLGRDAAIADHYKDLRIKNNTAYPIYLEAYASNGTLAINLYGKEAHAPGRKVEFETVFEATIPKPADIVKQDATINEGERVVTHRGRTGSKVSVYKRVLENGSQVSKEWFSSSSYRAVADEVSVGTKVQVIAPVPEIPDEPDVNTPPVEAEPPTVSPEPQETVPVTENSETGEEAV